MQKGSGEGFYKVDENNVLHFNPRRVNAGGYVLFSENVDHYKMPLDGWFWLDSYDDARDFFDLPYGAEAVIEIRIYPL